MFDQCIAFHIHIERRTRSSDYLEDDIVPANSSVFSCNASTGQLLTVVSIGRSFTANASLLKSADFFTNRASTKFKF
jgi:hypothetical protein